jgi:hypothetical protein
MIVSHRDKRKRGLRLRQTGRAFTGIERAPRLKVEGLEARVELEGLPLYRARLGRAEGGRKGPYQILKQTRQTGTPGDRNRAFFVTESSAGMEKEGQVALP